MARPRINYALAATLVASGVTLDEAARQTGAKTATSLRVGLSRRGVTQTSIKNATGNIQRLTAVATRVVSQASESLREDLASILAKHTTALGEIKAKPNLKHIKAVGDAIEPLARTAKIVHDWGNQSKEGMAMVGLWAEPAPQEPSKAAIDIQAVVDEPEKPSNPS